MAERDVFIPGSDNDTDLIPKSTPGDVVGRLTLLKHHPQTHDEASADFGFYRGEIDEVTTFLRASHHSLYLRYEEVDTPGTFELSSINYQAHQQPEIANPADMAGNMNLFSQIYAEEGLRGAFYPKPGVWVTHTSGEVYFKSSPREDESYLKKRTADWSDSEKRQFTGVVEGLMGDFPWMETIDPRVRNNSKTLDDFLKQIKRELWFSLPRDFRGLPLDEQRDYAGAFVLTVPLTFLSRYYRALSEREEYQTNLSLMGGDITTFWVGNQDNDEIGHPQEGRFGDIFKYEGSSYRLEHVKDEEPRGVQILVDRLIPSRALYRAVMPNILPVGQLYDRLEKAIKTGDNGEQLAIFEASRPHVQCYFEPPQPKVYNEE